MIRALAATLCLACGTAQASVAQHAIEAHLAPASGELRVVDEIRVNGLSRFAFRLADWLVIERLAVDGQPGAALRAPDGGYAVALPDTGSHLLRFELRGAVPPRDESPAAVGGARSSSGADGAYLPGFAAWVPVETSERMRYRLSLSVPRGHVGVATGSLLDERSDANGYHATFAVEHAAAPPSVFAGPYVVREQHHTRLRLRTYFHASLDALADDYLAAARAYIARYASLIGDYPYSDFHIVSAPLPVGLGFPNLTYVGRRVLPLPFMRTRSLAHEVLHNWWGNGVAVDYEDGNWSEGLTTYMADYALAAEQSEAAAREMRIRWLRDYAALPAARDRPARAFRAKRHQAAQVIGYNKVAFMLHMLAMEIGESAFDAGIARFWRRHAGRTAGWADLQAAFEHAAGRDLDWFFAQWLNRAGAPQLALGAHRMQRGDGGYRTRIELRQTAPPYRLRLPVVLTTRAGERRHEVTVDAAVTTLSFETAGRPLSVHVDPGSDVFRRLRAEETPPIMRDVTLDPATITLVAARNPDYAEQARALAGRLMDTAPRFDEPAAARGTRVPILLIAETAAVADLLTRLDTEAPATLPDAPHTASAWVVRRANGAPVLVVAAADAAALSALLRPLPHYGSRSYVLFDGSRAVHRGVWPLPRGPLYRELNAAP